MKTLNHPLAAGIAGAFLATFSAAAADPQSGAVQVGQGGAVSFFKKSTPRADAKGKPVEAGERTVKWAQQSIPNGPVVSYAVQERPRLEIAPLK